MHNQIYTIYLFERKCVRVCEYVALFRSFLFNTIRIDPNRNLFPRTKLLCSPTECICTYAYLWVCIFFSRSNFQLLLNTLCIVCCVLGCVHVCIRKSLLLAKNYRFHNILVFCSFSLYLSIYLRLPMMLPTHISTGSLKHPHHSTCKYELANIWNPEKPHAHIYIYTYICGIPSKLWENVPYFGKYFITICYTRWAGCCIEFSLLAWLVLNFICSLFGK